VTDTAHEADTRAKTTTTAADKAHAEVVELLDGYFRHTLRPNLDEDIPACAADIAQLCARRVAEALEELAGEPHPVSRVAAVLLRERAAEYRKGTR
jgi:hypothetical protein